MPVLLDFESVSRADLRVVGGRNYWAHPSTAALCCVLWDTEAGDLEIWEPGDPRPKLIDRGALGAHNGRGFDRFGCLRLGWPDIEIDTSELARAAGLPGSLDALGTRWLGRAKDKDASRFTTSLSGVRRPIAKTAHRAPGGAAISAEDWAELPDRERRLLGVQPEYGPAARDRVIAYCVSDVEILAHGWETLATWQDIEPDVQHVDRAINDRGVQFDTQLARRLLACDARNSEREIERVAKVIGETAERTRCVAASPALFGQFTGLPNAQAATIADAIADLSEHAQALCSARAALASITGGKLEAGLARVSPDGRLRDMHRYLGAHSWRWSGAGIQLQNMPRPDSRFESFGDAEICALIDRTLAGYWPDQAEIDLMLRGCIFAKPGHTLIVEDFSGVEARGLLWAAKDRRGIDVVLSGLDVYKVNASQIYGVRYDDVTKAQRTAGKVAELACGYQGGPGAIARFAKAMGINLAAAGIDPQRLVSSWRGMHKPIVDFWYACQRSFTDAATTGRTTHAGPFRFVPRDGRIAAIMPGTDRPLVYNDVQIGRDDHGRPALSYHGRMFREHLYGGKIAENLIQSFCRELLASALVECDGAGLDPVLHVHDEIVCEVPISAEADAREELHRIMTTVPEWAEGFPLGADGHSGTRYRK